MKAGLSRRGFLLGTSGTLVLSLAYLQGCKGTEEERDHASAPRETAPQEETTFDSWQDLYRQKWTWDRIAKGTHHVNCWYQRCCNWNVFVKDGIVWREEQSGTYEQTNPEVPDFNPRGCQKGACFSERMYDASRLQVPLKRVGERGGGKWKRVSWEEALQEIADKTIDVLGSDGPAGILWDEGSGGANLGVQRTGVVLDTPILDVDSEFGDHHPGAAVTCGKISFASSGDDLHYSDLILIWGGNPTYTQIPNAHFINEARYNGTRIVTIAPDYSASAIHADTWVPVNIASDAALGLSMAQVMLEEGIYDARFVKEQTDLAFLVRKDTRRFLREEDLKHGGAEDIFYLFDRVSATVRKARRDDLSIDGFDPALEGEYEVETLEGMVTVTPVFELLKKQLVEYTPERAVSITGVPPKLVRNLARMLSGARSACLITQSNFGKFYHGLEMERAQFLVFALAGQFGKKGSGINAFPNIWLSGHEGLIAGPGSLPPKIGLIPTAVKALPEIVMKKFKQEYTGQMLMYDLVRKKHAAGDAPTSTLFLHEHGGLQDFYGGAGDTDPYLKRSFDAHLQEAYAQGWQRPPGQRPRVFFEVGGNYLRRNRGYPKMLEELWPKLELVVTLDLRMSFTAMHSDYVLPAAGWYEQDSIPWTTPITPFVQVTTRAVEPLGESKTDWAFHCVLIEALQERAAERGVESYNDRKGESRSFASLYDNFTFGGRFTDEKEKEEDLWREALSLSNNVGDIEWEELKEKGFSPYTGLGTGYMNLGNATDVKPGETLTANTWHTEGKYPWPTHTRRMQFYIDHPLYFELGEELPVHKDLPKIGGDYPLQMTIGHTRWSIHASNRDQASLLRLQRGVPTLTLGVEDAQRRNVTDGDSVRVFNDMGDMILQARISTAIRPGQVIIDDAWEPYQFSGHKSPHAVTPSPMNPIQLAGGYTHLQPRLAVGTPGASDRGTRVEVERLEG